MSRAALVPKDFAGGEAIVPGAQAGGFEGKAALLGDLAHLLFGVGMGFAEADGGDAMGEVAGPDR